MVHTALAEVDSDVLTTGTSGVVNKIEAAETSTTTPAVELSYSPIGLQRGRERNRGC